MGHISDSTEVRIESPSFESAITIPTLYPARLYSENRKMKIIKLLNAITKQYIIANLRFMIAFQQWNCPNILIVLKCRNISIQSGCQGFCNI
jgi:hypothetical protein